MVAEEGTLPSAEAVEGHGDGDRHVDPYHANLYAVDEVSGGVAVAGEDGGSVAIFVLVDHLEGGFEVVDSHDSQDWAEDLFAIDLHLGFHVVEEAGSEEEPFASGQGLVAAVDDELGALFFSVLDVAGDALQVGLGDLGTQLGSFCHAVVRLQVADALLEFIQEGVGSRVDYADGY